MAYIVVACIVMAYVDMAYIVMANRRSTTAFWIGAGAVMGHGCLGVAPAALPSLEPTTVPTGTPTLTPTRKQTVRRPHDANRILRRRFTPKPTAYRKKKWSEDL